LNLLADEAEAYEPMIAGLMRKRIKAKLLLEAAGYFKGCADIPEGEKLRLLSAPLKDYDAKALWPLCTLPFELAATTNYDRALHDAFGKRRDTAPQCVELGDPTFKEALFWKDFYIARIHGRAELPDSMILDDTDYARLYSDNEYQDFLRSLLVQHRFIFVGFSFLDPAISKILEFLKARKIFPRLHYAFLPTGNQGLAEEMAAYNIRVFEYPPNNNHAVLWDGVSEAAGIRQRDSSFTFAPVTANFDTAKRLLATCYARVSMGDQGAALRQLVVDGIILSELSFGVGEIDTLVSKLRGYIALSDGEACLLVDSSVSRLVKKNVCMQDNNTIVLVENQSTTPPVQILADGIVARLRLREKFEITETILSSICNIVEEVIVLRGFDLGAEFSGASLRKEVDVFETITMAVDRHLGDYWQDKKHALAEVFREMLRHPDEREETLLGELGRIAFGIEIVLQAGRSTMYALSLPHIVYLDASVLLPAIVPGHPFRRAYLNAIAKLQDAARSSGGTVIQITDVFLDEVVSHRRKAIEFVKAGGLDDRETLLKRIQYYGADKVNVFIGAYSRWASTDKQSEGLSFGAFLAQEAPYETVAQLKGFLSKQGFKVASTVPKDPASVSSLAKIEEALDAGYDIEEASLDRRELKVPLLKKHEAAQLFAMHLDMEAGRRPILVTADTKLRRAVGLSSISTLKDSLISPQNLIQLVDLLVGIDVPPAFLARLLWSVRAVDDAAMLKDYLLSRALPTYNEALLLKMNDLLDSYVDQYVKQAKLEKINLMATGTEESLKTSRFMDRIEKEVFASLAIEVEKLRQRLRELEEKERDR